MMRCRQLARACLMVAAVMGVAAAARAQNAGIEEGKLKVTVEYKGQAGTVDKDHKIWIYLFDTPDITADSMPLAMGSISENKAIYKFIALPKQVYIAAAFDSAGGHDGSSGPPAPGSPITIHGSTGPGTAAPVPTGTDDAAVTVAFDDTVRMP